MQGIDHHLFLGVVLCQLYHRPDNGRPLFPTFSDLKSSYDYFIKRFTYGVLFLSFRLPQVQGIENIPLSGPLVVISNHPSVFDIFLMSMISPRFLNSYFFAEVWVVQMPFIRSIMRAAGYLEETRAKEPLVSAKAMSRATEMIKRGEAVNIFVFGNPLKAPRLYIFPSVFKILRETDPVIVPAYIMDGYKAEFPISNLKAKVIFGAPIRKEDILQGGQQYMKGVFETLGRQLF